MSDRRTGCGLCLCPSFDAFKDPEYDADVVYAVLVRRRAAQRKRNVYAEMLPDELKREIRIWRNLE